MAASRSQIERLLDLGVFAPLGLLLNREQTISDLAAAGRKQVAFSRSLGRAALKGLSKPAKPAKPAHAAKPAKPAKPAEPATDEPAVEVDGYESMTARELVAYARTCSDAEADWLRAAETAGKNRVTVIRALDARPQP